MSTKERKEMFSKTFMNENRYLYLAVFKMRKQVCNKYKNYFRTRRMLKVSKFKRDRMHSGLIMILLASLVTNLVLFGNDRFTIF